MSCNRALPRSLPCVEEYRGALEDLPHCVGLQQVEVVG
jgi:hypothetical protein